jgi:sugar (pentulose or hexulose) kinase
MDAVECSYNGRLEADFTRITLFFARNPQTMPYLGLDFGSAGARTCVIDDTDTPLHHGQVTFSPAHNTADWQAALFDLLADIPPHLRASMQALAINGTSGTVLLTDADFEPLLPAVLYNAPCAQTINLPSALAKGEWLRQRAPAARHFFHQADWLATLLTGTAGVSDYHNALKTGFDVVSMTWPAALDGLPMRKLLPEVVAPGSKIAPISRRIARHFSVNPACVVRAGTTDSIAAFIAAKVREPGVAVTSLGTTLVLKLLSTIPVNAPEYGVYSHKFGALWLAGGASNAGGGVLRQFFDDAELARLSMQIDPTRPSPLDYLPLPCPGERFPVNNPQLMPRLTPRPADDAAFLHGLLESLARIEAQGYARLAELGATPLRAVVSAGGGASNGVWQQIRERILSVPVCMASHTDAAYGSARLARLGVALLP